MAFFHIHSPRDYFLRQFITAGVGAQRINGFHGLVRHMSTCVADTAGRAMRQNSTPKSTP